MDGTGPASGNRTAELLYDSEATLRLVGRELEALRDLAPAAPQEDALAAAQLAAEAEASGALEGLPHLLQRASLEIGSALRSLRECRQALKHSALDQLQVTHAKLREVSSATEVATIDIMDGLDRAQQLVDELEATDGDPAAAERRGVLRTELRNEMFAVTGFLQFQDLTTQQLEHAASALLEVEERLAQLASLFDPRQAMLGEPASGSVDGAGGAAGQTFAPDAAYGSATARQDVVESVLRTTRPKG